MKRSARRIFMNNESDRKNEKNITQQETGEANFSIVRYFKYVLLIGFLSSLLLGGAIYLLIQLFSD